MLQRGIGLIAESAPSFNHDEKRSPFEWLHQSSPDRDSVEPSEGFRNSDHCDLSTTSAIVSLENGLEANNVAEESTSETPLITAVSFIVLTLTYCAFSYKSSFILDFLPF